MKIKPFILTGTAIFLIAVSSTAIFALSKNVVSPESAIMGKDSAFSADKDPDQQKITDEFNQLLKENKSTGELITFIKNTENKASDKTKEYLTLNLMEAFEKNPKLEYYSQKLDFGDYVFSDETEGDVYNKDSKYNEMYKKVYQSFNKLFDKNFIIKNTIGEQFAKNPVLIDKIEDETVRSLLKELTFNGYKIVLEQYKDPESDQVAEADLSKLDQNKEYYEKMWVDHVKIGFSARRFYIKVHIDYEKLMSLSAGKVKDFIQVVHLNDQRTREMDSIFALALASEKLLKEYKDAPKKVSATLNKINQDASSAFYSQLFTLPYLTKDEIAQVMQGKIPYKVMAGETKESIALGKSIIEENFVKHFTKKVTALNNLLKGVTENNGAFNAQCLLLKNILSQYEKKQQLDYRVLYTIEMRDFASKSFPKCDLYYDKTVEVLKKHFPQIKIRSYFEFGEWTEDAWLDGEFDSERSRKLREQGIVYFHNMGAFVSTDPSKDNTQLAYVDLNTEKVIGIKYLDDQYEQFEKIEYKRAK